MNEERTKLEIENVELRKEISELKFIIREQKAEIYNLDRRIDELESGSD